MCSVNFQRSGDGTRLDAARQRVSATVRAIAMLCSLGMTLLSAAMATQAVATSLTPAASMAQARTAHTSTWLPSGKVLVAGGYDGTAVLGTAQIYDPATNQWSSAGALSEPVFSHTATLLPSGKVLVAGGRDASGYSSDVTQVYDPVANTWSRVGLMRWYRAAHTATLLPSGKVLVAGGRNGPGITFAEIFDPASNAWSDASPMTTARFAHTANLLPSGKVLVAGGYNGTTYVAGAELYDPTTNSWSAASTLSFARSSHTATLLPSGKVLLAGGEDLTSYYGTAELYDPATNSWTLTQALIGARYGHTATLLPSGKVLVAGGYGSGYLSSSAIYDPAVGTWSLGASLIAPRWGATTTLLPSGLVLFGGGVGTGGTYLNSAELYDPATPVWSATGALGTARGYHTMTLLATGQVLLAGGTGGSALATGETYDPATAAWSASGTMSTARYHHTATLLPSGKVLAAGGFTGTAALNSAELYDPATNTWSSAGALGAARYLHTATLLPTGKVLVAGGIGTTAINGAELYDPATNTWSAVSSLNAARYQHTATLLTNGKVMVAGGNDGPAIGSTELYDPTANTWTTVGALATARYRHSATLLPSGKVLAAAGTNSVLLNSAELFDPATNTWGAAGSLAGGRWVHTATMLPSGKVLVAGGTAVVAIASTEIYDPATNAWSTGPTLAAARYAYAATLLASGKVLISGGANSALLASSELFDVGAGFAENRRPAISSVIGSFAATLPLQLSGTGFVGDSEASAGNSTSSATNFPLVHLRRLDNQQQAWLHPATSNTRSNTSYLSRALSGLTTGPYAVTVFVNGIPSVARIAVLQPLHTVSTTVSPPGAGLSGCTPNPVLDGTASTCSFTALGPYVLTNISGCGGVSSSSSPYTTGAVTGPCTVTATFTNTTTYAITTSASPAAGGTVSCLPNPVIHGGSATCAATASVGYTFANWSGDCVGGGACSFTNVTSNKSVTANFNRIQTITGFNPVSPVVFGAPAMTLSATGGDSGNPVVFATTSAPSVCTVSGNQVTFTGTGTCVLTANQAGAAGFNAAAQVTASIVINIATQSLSFAAQAPAFQALVIGGIFPVNPLAVAGASSSPVTYSVSPPNVCSISGTTITMNGLGSCAITANQAADANYAAADPVTRNVEVVATLDVDRSLSVSQYHAHTDGLLILRYLSGVTDTALVANATSASAARASPAAVTSYLDAIRSKLDVDGNGVPDAATDGVLIVRYLLGFRGAALVENALATSPPATRVLPAEVEIYLQALMP